MNMIISEVVVYLSFLLFTLVIVLHIIDIHKLQRPKGYICIRLIFEALYITSKMMVKWVVSEDYLPFILFIELMTLNEKVCLRLNSTLFLHEVRSLKIITEKWCFIR